MLPSRELFSSPTNAAAVATVTAVSAASCYYLWRMYKLRVPKDVQLLGKVEKLIIYPIKSLPGVELDTATVTTYGLQYGPFKDRSFVLLKKESGLPVTMRTEPTLALLKLSLEGNQLIINAKGLKTLRIHLKETLGQNDVVETFRLYGQDVEGVDCGDDVGEWFSKFLVKPGFCLKQFLPKCKPRNLLKNLLQTYNPGVMIYHDESTYLLLSQASVDDLNSRMDEAVTYKNFRPNFLITGCQAFAEDQMKVARIGDSVLLYMAQCPRCILTTVNPETGIKTEKEPLVTLRTYRLAKTEKLKEVYGKSPLFGVFMGTRKEGTVSAGDNCYFSSL